MNTRIIFGKAEKTKQQSKHLLDCRFVGSSHFMADLCCDWSKHNMNKHCFLKCFKCSQLFWFHCKSQPLSCLQNREFSLKHNIVTCTKILHDVTHFIINFTYLLNNSILQDDYHKAKKSKMLAETLQDVRHINFCFYKINVQIWNTDILINAIVLKVKKCIVFPFCFWYWIIQPCRMIITKPRRERLFLKLNWM